MELSLLCRGRSSAARLNAGAAGKNPCNTLRRRAAMLLAALCCVLWPLALGAAEFKLPGEGFIIGVLDLQANSVAKGMAATIDLKAASGAMYDALKEKKEIRAENTDADRDGTR